MMVRVHRVESSVAETIGDFFQTPIVGDVNVYHKVADLLRRIGGILTSVLGFLIKPLN